jgi:hypothetical protein
LLLLLLPDLFVEHLILVVQELLMVQDLPVVQDLLMVQDLRVVQELLMVVVLPIEMLFAAPLKFLPKRVRLQNLHRNRSRSFLVELKHQDRSRYRWGWRSNR